MAQIISDLKSKGKKIIHCHGVFDLLHIGHIKHFKEAKTFGDILIVGLNSNKSVKSIKSKDRPINSENDRAYLLAALESVDYVVIFDEDTPLEAMTVLEPDIIVKGGDYTFDTVVGNHLAEVVIFPTVEGHSTSATIKKIDNSN